MPGFDGTGPQCQGSGTGRGRGQCENNATPGRGNRPGSGRRGRRRFIGGNQGRPGVGRANDQSN